MAQPMTDASPNEKLQSALAAFDRSRTPEEYRANQERVCSLGPDVAPSVIAALSEPQDPERSDLLLTLLRRWVPLDQVLALARNEDAGWILRASLAEALRFYAEALHPSEVRNRHRIAATLALLARDAHDGVRGAAVDSVGLARLAGMSELRPVLSELAASDPNASIREEAQEALREID